MTHGAGGSSSDLDALVAEKVMGWRLENIDSRPLYDRDGAPLEGGPEWVDQDGNHVSWAWNWRPSERIADAWEVVELLARRAIVRIETRGSSPAEEELERGWQCGIANADGSQMLYRYAPLAPLAICRAALALVQGEDKPQPPPSYSI